MSSTLLTIGDRPTAVRTNAAAFPFGLGGLLSTLILRVGLRRPTRSG